MKPFPCSFDFEDSSEFERISGSLADALDFTSTVGVGDGQPYEAGGGRGVLGEVDFYTRYAYNTCSLLAWDTIS